MRLISCNVQACDGGRTVRSILTCRLGLAPSLVTRLKQRPGAVLVNGAPARSIDRVRAGDTVSADVADTRPGGRFEPVAGYLDVLWEDDDLVIINKPAGLAVHGRAERGEPTIANLAAAYLGPEVPFHPVNRLDRGTSGCMAIAKTGYMHNALRLILHSESFTRGYVAIAVGEVNPPSGRIDLPIARVAEKKFGVREDGAASATNYETVCSDGKITLLRIVPETGRTHQIRVHMQAVGYPLLGDRLYGRVSDEIARPALHSETITLLSPATGATISVRAPMPQDMRKVLTDHEKKAETVL